MEYLGMLSGCADTLFPFVCSQTKACGGREAWGLFGRPHEERQEAGLLCRAYEGDGAR